MKIAITGHTKGLGLALKQIFEKNDHQVTGFSRTNGFDIGLKPDRQKLISLSEDCDIFINNAYFQHAQTDLLYEFFKSWHDKDRTIINIGSSTTDGIKDHVWPYSSHKASLEKASEQLSFLNLPCQVILFKFGWIGTERVLSEYKPHKYLLPQDAAEFIFSQLKWAKKYRPTEFLIRP